MAHLTIASEVARIAATCWSSVASRPRRCAATSEIARCFLAGRAARGEFDLGRLWSAEVTGFVVTEARRRSVGSMKVLTSALRSLLRFLLVTGVVGRDLAAAVPTVAAWRRCPRRSISPPWRRCLGAGDRGSRSGCATTPCSPSSCALACAPGRSRACAFTTWTEARARWSSGARGAASTGCLFLRTSRRLPTTCAVDGHGRRPDRCARRRARGREGRCRSVPRRPCRSAGDGDQRSGC